MGEASPAQNAREVSSTPEDSAVDAQAAARAKAARKALKKARKRARRRRRLTLLTVFWIATALVAGIAFSAVVSMYAATTTAPPRPDFGRSVVSVYIEPVQVLPAEGRVVADLTVTVPPQLMEDGLRLSERLSLTFFAFSGSQTVVFAKGTPALELSAPLRVRVDHDSYTRYPWDNYESQLWVLASMETPQGAVWEPVSVGVWGDMPGWHVVPASVNSRSSLQRPSTSPYVDSVADVTVNVRRAGSTQAIVVMLLGAMVVLAALGLVVVVAVSRRRRRVEATLAGWFAAMLFALVPLRLNMPGSPPIGAWIDILVFLWVVLALMLALTVFVVTWLRFTPAPEPVRHKKRKRARKPGSTKGHPGA